MVDREPRASSTSTSANFGFHAELVTNAAPYQDAVPSPVDTPIRLVHSGACLRNRRLHIMAEAVDAAANDVTLDFYLTAERPALPARSSRSSRRRPSG